MSWSSSSVTANTGSTAPTDQGQSGNKKDSTLASFYSSITLPSGHLLGGVLGDDDDDRRPSTPRNASPAQIGDFEELEGNNGDLLVFGYECKIFRDDDRAQWVEDEKHLIPWMGHRDLQIDRYDCRGALMDISRYESRQVSSYQDEPIAGILSNAQNSDDAGAALRNLDETLLERELDEERYRDLNEDEDYDDDAYNRDVQYRKLHPSINGMKTEKSGTGDSRHYASFQYNYNEKNHNTCIGPEPKRLHDDDAPYTKPVGLYIPEEISLPKTMKNHAIIVKTAKFIASQGNQMEIILKTKQAGNPLFDFLTHSGKLNPYYKFMVHAIRTGIYRPPDEESNDVNSSTSSAHDCSGGEDDGDHTYLHPSLFRASNTASSIPETAIPAIASSRSLGSSSSRHNAYSMLVSKIKGTESPDPIQTGYSTNNVQLPPAVVVPDPNQTNSLLSNYGYNIPSGPPAPTPSNDTHRAQKQLPSTQDQLIIEKMASYVIKNGASFEAVAKNKGDPRFGFLNSEHDYHWYYLNCKERFKAESNAVVASSNFVNYSEKSAPAPIPATTPGSSISSSTVKKSVAMELAELKRKSVLASKKSGEVLGKEKNGGSATTGTSESVFSQAGLVKEKDKPVIRFASSLSLTLTSGPPPSCDDLERDKEPQPNIKAKQSSPRGYVSPQRSARSPLHVDSDNDPEDCVNPFDDTRIGNTPPQSDDEEQVKRQMERRRKAAIFLQRLKMKSAGDEIDGSKTSTTGSAASKEAPLAVSSTSLGDLLSRRLLADNVEKTGSTSVVLPLLPEPRIENDEDDMDDDVKSSGSSRHSNKSKFHKSSRKRRSYSFSSTGSSTSESHYSKKKSSKRKHRKKKKKHEKSSRTSSRKSKRRK